MKECLEMLKEGAAVSVASAKRGLENANKIVVAEQEGGIIGLATLKSFRPSYTARIATHSSTSIERGAIELGYVAVRGDHRRSGLGRELVKALLEGVSSPLFATTASAAMKKILSEQGFVKSGKTWSGQAGRLSLWQRKQIAKAK